MSVSPDYYFGLVGGLGIGIFGSSLVRLYVGDREKKKELAAQKIKEAKEAEEARIAEEETIGPAASEKDSVVLDIDPVSLSMFSGRTTEGRQRWLNLLQTDIRMLKRRLETSRGMVGYYEANGRVSPDYGLDNSKAELEQTIAELHTKELELLTFTAIHEDVSAEGSR